MPRIEEPPGWKGIACLPKQRKQPDVPGAKIWGTSFGLVKLGLHSSDYASAKMNRGALYLLFGFGAVA